MRAMVHRGPDQVQVAEAEVPAIEHSNDAIVRLSMAAIWGSDLHLYHRMMPDTRVGFTLGHEFVGVVEDLSSGTRSLRRGDRVMVPFNIVCGTCWFCAQGRYFAATTVIPTLPP